MFGRLSAKRQIRKAQRVSSPTSLNDAIELANKTGETVTIKLDIEKINRQPMVYRVAILETLKQIDRRGWIKARRKIKIENPKKWRRTK